MKKFRSYVFKGMCLLLALNFLPEVALLASDEKDPCYQLEESLPESESEHSCTDTSTECAEDTTDSFLHSSESIFGASRLFTLRLQLFSILSILQKDNEILIPPPRLG